MPKLRQSIPSEVREKLGQMAGKLSQTKPESTIETGEGEEEAAERVAILIDGENLIPRAEANSGFRLNFRKLRDFLAAGRKVGLAQWFDSYKDSAERERKERLYLALTLSGFTVRALPLRNGHKLKSRVDPYLQAEISERLLLEDRGEEPFTHTFILVSGDSDFYPIIQLLKRHGRRVEVAYLGNTLSRELKSAADRLIDLGEHLEELVFNGSADGKRKVLRGIHSWGNRPQLEPERAISVDKAGEKRGHTPVPIVITVIPSRRTKLWRLLRRLTIRF